MHLPEETFQKIVSLINRAKIETERKAYDKALEFCQKAESIFPQPIESYTGACFLFLSMGELLLLMQQTDKAFAYFTRANDCADGLNDAKICYQLGLIHLHRGDIKEAKRQLTKAYTLGGESLFTSELEAELAFFNQHIFQTA